MSIFNIKYIDPKTGATKIRKLPFYDAPGKSDWDSAKEYASKAGNGQWLSIRKMKK